ncbi:hypothetical protein [Pedobacter sp. V48]|uniref:LIC_13387 family protein n=1 Tax=Pedobacter sp. V48 TaxID=509635 RepID=UPI0003E58C7C|nr:hypothetical protein [Pedobacter sp. V48]ETZ20870.1 hypothetical protein N824_29725 [Pedobacter sp. V48]
MNAKLLIRISVFLLFVHLIGHFIGHVYRDEAEGSLGGVAKVIKSRKVVFMGVDRSLADYSNSYSWMLFGLYAMSMILLWQLSSYLKENRNLAKRLLFQIGITYLFFGTIELLYFFPFAAVVSFLVGLLILLSTRIR